MCHDTLVGRWNVLGVPPNIHKHEKLYINSYHVSEIFGLFYSSKRVATTKRLRTTVLLLPNSSALLQCKVFQLLVWHFHIKIPLARSDSGRFFETWKISHFSPSAVVHSFLYFDVALKITISSQPLPPPPEQTKRVIFFGSQTFRNEKLKGGRVILVVSTNTYKIKNLFDGERIVLLTLKCFSKKDT